MRNLYILIMLVLASFKIQAADSEILNDAYKDIHVTDTRATRELRKELELIASSPTDRKAYMIITSYSCSRELLPNSIFEVINREANQGNSHFKNLLGYIYEKGLKGEEDHQKAMMYYRQAAEEGNCDAQINLGWIYGGNLNSIPANYLEAIIWYKKAITHENISEQERLFCQEHVIWLSMMQNKLAT